MVNITGNDETASLFKIIIIIIKIIITDKTRIQRQWNVPVQKVQGAAEQLMASQVRSKS